MQSRTHSLIETITNITIGYIVAILSQLLIYPVFDIHIPITDNLLIGAYFTAISLVRGYMIRRYFTRKTEQDWRIIQ